MSYAIDLNVLLVASNSDALLQHGVTTLYTRDTDFRRFDFLDLRDPF